LLLDQLRPNGHPLLQAEVKPETNRTQSSSRPEELLHQAQYQGCCPL